jgi:hypothetical protein
MSTMIRDPSDGSVRTRKATIASLKERYGDTWGINPPPDMPAKPPVKAPTVEELTEFYRNNPERVMRLLGDQNGDTECTGK